VETCLKSELLSITIQVLVLGNFSGLLKLANAGARDLSCRCPACELACSGHMKPLALSLRLVYVKD
jgi:hypothetical protein